MKKICIGRDAFDERNISFDFVFLDVFFKMLDWTIFFFSFSHNRILISLDNPEIFGNVLVPLESDHIQQVD